MSIALICYESKKIASKNSCKSFIYSFHYTKKSQTEIGKEKQEKIETPKSFEHFLEMYFLLDFIMCNNHDHRNGYKNHHDDP
jgi:hypothetical protein